MEKSLLVCTVDIWLNIVICQSCCYVVLVCMCHCQLVLGETSSPAASNQVVKSKHVSSTLSDHRKSSGSHARSSTGASKGPGSVSAVPDPGVGKAKNVCVVEPQSTMSKATAVVAPLVATTESHQFTKLFGEPLVKSDASKKRHGHHHHQKVCQTHYSHYIHYSLHYTTVVYIFLMTLSLPLTREQHYLFSSRSYELIFIKFFVDIWDA